jgi:hypothetical protein
VRSGDDDLDVASRREIKAAIERSAVLGVDWVLWRPVVSADIADGLDTIRRRWSLRDLYEAHVVLDTLDAMRDIETARQRREADKSSRGPRTGLR